MISVTLVLALLSATLALPTENVQGLPEHPEGHIINGQQAVLGQFPHQAWLEITFKLGKAGCGGSLISDRWILTAAHCTDGSNYAEVILGTVDKTNSSVSSYRRITSNTLITHEKYSASELDNDIALILLDEPVELNEFINIVKLPKESPIEDQLVTASGYGSTTGYGESSSDVLNWVTTPVLNRSESKSKCFMKTQDPLKICIYTGGPKGVCSGDSGGPLNSHEDMTVRNGVIYGVASYVTGGGCSGGPHVFLSVAGYLDWIEEHTGITP